MRGGTAASCHVSRNSISALATELTGSADRPAASARAASSSLPTLASLIGLLELLAQTKQTAEFSANLFEAFTLATLIYFTLNMSLMLLMRLIEKKVAVPGLMSLGGK